MVTSFTRDGDTGSRVLHALIGVLAVIVGFALLRTPFQSVEVFIFVLGIFWLIQGIMTFVAAFAVKQGRNWRLFSGILGIVAGIIILVYPITSAVTLAFIGGIWLVILGVTQVIAGFQLRRSRSVALGGITRRVGPSGAGPARRSVLSCRAAPDPGAHDVRGPARPGPASSAPA